VRPRVAIPVHYEGWSHFKQGRTAVERAFAEGPEDVRTALRWLPIGTPVDLSRSDVPVTGRRPGEAYGQRAVARPGSRGSMR
jgi:hypothetical protein